MQSFPLISIVGNKIFFEAQKEEGEPNETISEINDQTTPQLRAMLKRQKAFQDQVGGPVNLRGQVNIQADEKTPIEEVKKVMRVLIEENWTGINFIVDPSSEKH